MRRDNTQQTNAVCVRLSIYAKILLAISLPSAVSGFMILRGSANIGIPYDKGITIQKRQHARSKTVHEAKRGNAVDDDGAYPKTTFDRSNFLIRSGALVTSALATLFVSDPIHSALAAVPTSTEAVAQLKAAVSTTDRLLRDWDTITSKGGDAIRTELGTNGGSSPLFQIDKAVKVIQMDVAEDPVAFAEASEEFLLGVGRASSMAYSSIFAGGSGKPTPPSVYIAKSKEEVLLIRRYEMEMLEAMGK